MSPAAQAVMFAYAEHNGGIEAVLLYERQAIAAALRAAADQVLAAQWKGRIQPDAAHSLGINWTRDALHAIAAELEGAQ
jgi:hypothetical protein